MTPIGRLGILASALLSATMAARAADNAAAPPAKDPPPTTRVLVLGGLSGDARGAYARNMRDWIKRFVALMQWAKVPAGNITVLAEAADPAAKPPVGRSTLVNVRAAFERIAKEIGPRDQFVLFLVGHGTVTEPVGKLCLPGPDLNADELAKRLDGLLTRQVVVVNCASGAAEFLSKVARPGRVVVSATGEPGEGIQTYFAEFFLLGYETRKADRSGDGRITVLEAFNWAAAECVDWYHRQLGVKLKLPKGSKVQYLSVRGKETCRLFKKFYEGTNLKLHESSQPDELDSDPAGGGKGRETTELASLEDRGEPTKAAVHWVRNEHVHLEGKPGQQGHVAAATVLGSPSPPEPAKK